MPNPTFRSGPITFAAKADVKKFRLVKVADGGVQHAADTGAIFGAVTENASAPKDPAANSLVLGASNNVAVHIGPATVPLEVNGTATDIKAGAPVYAAADGKVAATGTVVVGVAARDGHGTTVKTTLLTPIAV